jgi:hypothetical protein
VIVGAGGPSAARRPSSTSSNPFAPQSGGAGMRGLH